MRKGVILDAFDRRLLEMARSNNLTPARELAAEIGLSVSAVLRRLRRLRAEKVIVADTAVVDPSLTGSGVTIHVLVRMHRAGARNLDEFADKVAACPDVTGVWDIAGDDDFLLKVQLASLSDYDGFMRRTLCDENGVHSYRTLVTIRQIKDTDVSGRPLLPD